MKKQTRSDAAISKMDKVDTAATLGSNEDHPANKTEQQNVRDALGNWANLAYGEDTVSTAGTAEALNGGTNQSVPRGAKLLIRALNSNGGKVYVGDSSVGSSTGYDLDAGETVSLQPNDVSDVFIDTDNNGEGVRWIVEVT